MFRIVCSQTVRAAALAILAVNLIADDNTGVVLIDQRIAMMGKVTAGDAPGFPVTIDQPGIYRLSGNLTVPDTITTAIHIAADS